MMYIVKEAVYIQVNRIVQMLYLHEPAALCNGVFRGAVWAKAVRTLMELCFTYNLLFREMKKGQTSRPGQLKNSPFRFSIKSAPLLSKTGP